jgi:hypothetical protein
VEEVDEGKVADTTNRYQAATRPETGLRRTTASNCGPSYLPTAIAEGRRWGANEETIPRTDFEKKEANHGA